MVQCEMCGAETADPNRVKIEGAELDVCDECTDFGTEVKTEESSSTSTKYSTSSSSSSSSSSGPTSRSSSSSSSGGGGGRDDIYDDIEELAQDYDDRIRSAREAAGLTQEELAKQINEKASLLRTLEHGNTLPSDDVQRKLERALDIDLTVGGGDEEDTEWSGGSSTGEYTLGDVVERKD